MESFALGFPTGSAFWGGSPRADSDPRTYALQRGTSSDVDSVFNAHQLGFNGLRIGPQRLERASALKKAVGAVEPMRGFPGGAKCLQSVRPDGLRTDRLRAPCVVSGLSFALFHPRTEGLSGREQRRRFSLAETSTTSIRLSAKPHRPPYYPDAHVHEHRIDASAAR